MDEDVKRFYDIVRDMRRYQKAYFATRSNDALCAAKYAEREVDGLISKHFNQTL